MQSSTSQKPYKAKICNRKDKESDPLISMVEDDDGKQIVYNGAKDATEGTLDFLKDKLNEGFNVYISLLDEE